MSSPPCIAWNAILSLPAQTRTVGPCRLRNYRLQEQAHVKQISFHHTVMQARPYPILHVSSKASPHWMPKTETHQNNCGCCPAAAKTCCRSAAWFLTNWRKLCILLRCDVRFDKACASPANAFVGFFQWYICQYCNVKCQALTSVLPL